MINGINSDFIKTNNVTVLKSITSPRYFTAPNFRGANEIDKFEKGDSNISPLMKERLAYKTKLPEAFSSGIDNLKMVVPVTYEDKKISEEIKALFPHAADLKPVEFKKSPKILGNTAKMEPPKKVGVLLSGGPAPGGHSVIAGIFDALKSVNPNSTLYGFKKGPDGLVKNEFVELSDNLIDKYRNTGGFDMLQSSRKKIESNADKLKTLENCKALGLDTLIIIGGDDSNTNAAVLNEFFQDKGANIKVIGCPKTIDGDLKNEFIDTSFGFDTAAKIYSNLISNLQTDAVSSNKYWHFVKLMGRSASNLTLECALQTHPNIALISEEVEAKQMSLDEVVESIVKVIVERSKQGKDYGTVLIPEGLIEFIPEFKYLLNNINDILAENPNEVRRYVESLPDSIREHLSKENQELLDSMLTSEEDKKKASQKLKRFREIFDTLPETIKDQITQARDEHGNVPLSIIQTDELLMAKVKARLDELKSEGKYNSKFVGMGHFYGYEGRCDFPSNFDTNYGYALGYNSIALASAGLTGYISTVNNLKKPTKEWIPGGAPLAVMMGLETRKGESKPVIRKSLVDLKGKPFKMLADNREKWGKNDSYRVVGPIQYKGKSADDSNFTVRLS